MITIDEFSVSSAEEAFEVWLIEEGYDMFVESGYAEVEAKLTSPRYTEGITLTGAD